MAAEASYPSPFAHASAQALDQASEQDLFLMGLFPSDEVVVDHSLDDKRDEALVLRVLGIARVVGADPVPCHDYSVAAFPVHLDRGT